MSKNENLHYKSAFNFLFKFIKPHKRWYFISVIISISIIGINIFQTHVTSCLINDSTQGDGKRVILDLSMFILIIGFNIGLNYRNSYACGKLGALASRDIKTYIYNKLIDSKYAEIQKVKSGDVLSTINSDTNNVSNFIVSDLTGLFSQFAMALGGLIYLSLINPLLCIITFAYTPIGMFFTLTLNKNMKKLYGENAAYKGEALSVVEQALSCIPVIKSFVMEKEIKRRVRAQYDNVYKADMKISVYNALMQPACYTTSYVPKILYLLYGGHLVLSNELSIGLFIATLNLLDFIIGPTVYFPFLMNSFNKSIASINRIKFFESLSEDDNKILSNENCKNPKIKIENLSFGYNDDKNIINDLSFQYNKPGIVALCGKSGCGKTTLLDIMAGLYTPNNGTIELESSIGVVSQDTYLFPVSVMDNIRYGKVEASYEDVIKAAEKAGADSFIKALPYGYDTIVGDGNNNLSGGQRQRISLARVILKNADIWLLDEPTSALDKETESIILNTMKEHSKEKLIIVSAHRKSLIDCADVVLNVEEVSYNEAI